MIRFLVLSTLLGLSASTTAVTILSQESFADFEARGLRAGGGDGTLDSSRWRVTGASSGDTAFGDSTTADELARGVSSGGVRSGGLYAFSLPAGRRGLGFQATSADFTPGALIASVANDTQLWMNHLLLAFELWWRNDGARSTEIETQVSFDGTSWLSAATVATPLAADDLGWHLEPQLLALGWNADAPGGSPQAITEAITEGITEGINKGSPPVSRLVAPGSEFWLRWQFDDAAGSGSRDEFALTSLRVFASPVALTSPMPVILSAPPTLWCISLFIIMLGASRLRRYWR